MSDQEIKVDIELLKKDVITMSALLEKFDTTIDKMQEIASNLSRMVSLQEQRLENQEKITAEVQSVLEMRRQEHNNNIKEVYNRINTVNKELTDKIQETEKELTDKIQETEKAILEELHKIRGEISKDKTGLADRLVKVETWKYAIGIVIIVVAWFAGQTKILSKFIE